MVDGRPLRWEEGGKGEKLEIGDQRSEIIKKDKAPFDIKIKDTYDLINKIKNDELPDKIMINVHPQRWTDDSFGWYKELILQSMKNPVKSMIVKYKRSRNP